MLGIWLWLAAAGQQAAALPPPEAMPPLAAMTPEQRLALLVNAYRQAHGLPPVALSPSLTRVAEAHAANMAARPDKGADTDLGTDSDGTRCNAHSWFGEGPGKPVCYTPDGRRAEGMWDKPREVTKGVYDSDGYEIAYWHSASATPEAALASWQKSGTHDAVIRETGEWAGAHWRAMGVGVSGHYAFVWFGKAADPAGSAPPKAAIAALDGGGRR